MKFQSEFKAVFSSLISLGKFWLVLILFSEPALAQISEKTGTNTSPGYAKTEIEPQILRISEIENALRRLEDAGSLQDCIPLLLQLGQLYSDLDRKKDASSSFASAIKLMDEFESDDVVALFNLLEKSLSLFIDTEQYKDAEITAKRLIGISYSAMPDDTAQLVDGLQALAGIYFLQNDYTKAEGLYLDIIRLIKAGTSLDTEEIKDTYFDLSELYLYQIENLDFPSELETARILLSKIDIIDRNEALTGDTKASVFMYTAKVGVEDLNYELAEDNVLKAISIYEETNDTQRLHAAKNNLAGIFLELGKVIEAEALYFEILENRNNALSPVETDIALSLNNLAGLYETRRMKANQEALLLRALDIFENQETPLPETIITLNNNLGVFYSNDGDHTKALFHLENAHQSMMALPKPEYEKIIFVMNAIANAHHSQGNHIVAEEIIKEAILIAQEKFGANYHGTAKSMRSLSNIYRDLHEKFYDEGNMELHHKYRSKAEKNHIDLLKVYKNVFGPFHADVGELHGEIAWLIMGRNSTYQQKKLDYIQAQSHTKSAVEIIRQNLSVADGMHFEKQAALDTEVRKYDETFYIHGFLSQLLAQALEPEKKYQHMETAYQSAQYMLWNRASRSIQLASARKSVNKPRLEEIIRKRQDLQKTWKLKESIFLEGLQANDGSKNREVSTLRTELSEMRRDLVEIDKQIQELFPDYYDFIRPTAISLEDTMSLLSEDEAMVVMIPGEGGVLVFAINNTTTEFSLAEIYPDEVSEGVRVLRSSVENPHSQFPRKHAYGLYQKLFKDVKEVFEDKKHVFVIRTGDLTRIPPSILVTEPPYGNDLDPVALSNTRWWGIEQAITLVPSVTSLEFLKGRSSVKGQLNSFVGFGDPMLRNPNILVERGESLSEELYNKRTFLLSLGELPNTSNELHEIAYELGVNPEKSLFLQENATEEKLRTVNLSGIDVIAFATHGLLGNEIPGLEEPALVLTLPHATTGQYDGLLTASEVATLELSADWIILSACNTAAPNNSISDGLAGLSQAFFYAGAKSVMASNWPVRDDVAKQLSTSTITTYFSNSEIGGAEALRLSMQALIRDKSDPHNPHPSNWAPFVVVGSTR